MDTKIIVTALILVPLILVLGTATFHGVSTSVSFTVYETAVVNETLGTGANQCFNTAYDCKSGSVLYTTNGTSVANWTGYNVSYSYYAPCSICFNSSAPGIHNATYTGYSGHGYTALDTTQAGTWQGFNLASLLPYIYIAIAVVITILGAFGLTKIM